MRKGTNPAKLDDNKVENDCFHQIIVPVYLPELTGYYEQGLDILKICLDSIYLTVHDKTFISVINNGSCEAVKTYLDDCLKAKKIHEVIHTTAIGKINGIAKGLSGHDFDLVTITDADVLFVNGWQKAVYDIYEAFPKAGMVCTTPQSKRLRYLTENIYFDNLFNSKLKFRTVQNPQALFRFAKSIDNPNLFKHIHLKKILSIKKNEITAVVGAGHFSATFRKEQIKHLKKVKTIDKISPENDKKHIDLPSIKKGFWRLSTYDNFTYHLGNSIDTWVKNEFKSLKKEKYNFRKPTLIMQHVYFDMVDLKKILIKNILFRKFIWRRYLKVLGLTEDEAKIF